MCCRVREPLPRLSEDAYLLRHLGDLDYTVTRLVRGDRLWHYVGSTHEYLTSGEPFTVGHLGCWAIDDRADGGSRGDKLDRDRQLLERDLLRDPDDARSTFYLAQTQRDLGHDADAIELYRRRVELGGWAEEVFYAQYQRGRILARSNWDAAVPVLLDAWQRRPRRAEPLHELAVGYRNRGAHHLAYTFARLGTSIPRPDDILFVHADVYEHALAFELAIAAYWVGEVEEALAINDRLLDQRLPDRIESLVRFNREWCLYRLGHQSEAPAPLHPSFGFVPPLGTLVPSVNSDRVWVDAGDWPSFNPTIAASDHGLRMIVRTANYRLSPRGVHHDRRLGRRDDPQLPPRSR